MRRLVTASAVAAALLLVSGSAGAKDLSGRVGVGYQNTLPGTGSAISARYWVNQNVGIQGDLGLLFSDPKTGDSSNNFGLGVAGMYAFVNEPNLHLYGTGGLSFGSVAVPGPTGVDDKTAIGLDLGIGTEFFLSGLPNLGLTTEFGLQYVTVSDVGNTLSLGGADFATLGIRYYFGGPTSP
jgi:hypothetical protein